MSEPRDVLAKAIRRHRMTQRPEIEHFAEGVLDHLYHGDADAGLAALRAEGWAVVRTADVEAAMCDARNFRLQMRGWERADGTPVYEMDDDTEGRLEEAIR